MIFSVYDYATRLYTYYDVDARHPPTAWFRPPRSPVPESLAVQLPVGARMVGQGPQARGVIATTSQGVGSLTPAGEQAATAARRVTFWGLLAGFIAGAWWARRSRK